MFTERFLSVPSLIFHPEEDYTGKCPQISCNKSFNPMRIESYSECALLENFVEENKIYTYVVMQSGDAFTATIPKQQFEKLINDFIK